MNSIDTRMFLSNCVGAIDNLIMEDEFVAPDGATNEEAALLHDMHKAMTSFIVSSHIRTHTNRLYEQSKKALETCSIYLGAKTATEPGKTNVIYSNPDYVFTKRQNISTKSVDVKALTIALHQLGVDTDIINKATKAATKERKGSVFYSVTTNY